MFRRSQPKGRWSCCLTQAPVVAFPAWPLGVGAGSATSAADVPLVALCTNVLISSEE